MNKEKTEVCQGLQIRYKELWGNGKISKLSYLMKFQRQDNVGQLRFLLDYRRIVCHMLLHPEWEYYLLLHLRNSCSFRFKFFIWILKSLQTAEGRVQGWVCVTLLLSWGWASSCHSEVFS